MGGTNIIVIEWLDNFYVNYYYYYFYLRELYEAVWGGGDFLD